MTMYRFIHRRFKPLRAMLIIASLLTSSTILANTALTGQSGGSDGGQGQDSIAGYTPNHWQQSAKSVTPFSALFVQNPSYDNSLATTLFYYNYLRNIRQLYATKPSTPKQLTPSQNAINAVLTASANNATDILFRGLTNIPTPLDSSGNIYTLTKDRKLLSKKVKNDPKTAQQFLSPLSLDNFITPLQYNEQQQDSADEFINTVSNAYVPTPLINLSVLNNDQLQTLINRQGIPSYINMIRRLAANQSIGLGNLHYLYDQRVSQKNPADSQNTSSSLPANLKKNASPLAIDQWQATYRLQSSKAGDENNWVNQIQKATPATLQREMVQLLAEIRMEMFKNRMVNQRILATLSALQLQDTTSAVKDIRFLEQTLCSQPPLKGTGACPPSPPVPSAN